MSILIDTHAHLYVKQFQHDLPAVLERAESEGVHKIFLPAIDTETHAAMLSLEAQNPVLFDAMMGLHPCSVTDESLELELKAVENYLAERPFCAIGEIGIDLYWDKTFFEAQKKALVRQMHWAESLKIPIVIHSREATEAIIAVLKENTWYTQGGIFHCFTGTVEQARTIIGLGFWLGIGGVVTFKNGGLAPVLQEISLENLVLETDAPYLAPIPFRGKRNESSYLTYIAQRIADIKELDIDQVATQTTANALKVFSKKNEKLLSLTAF
jgi:TatD DNase family protein